MDNKEEGSEHSKNMIESGAPRNTTEEERLADLAESIHINPPMATMTNTREQVLNNEIHYVTHQWGVSCNV